MANDQLAEQVEQEIVKSAMDHRDWMLTLRQSLFTGELEDVRQARERFVRSRIEAFFTEADRPIDS